jgi:hypothetical protein
MKNILIHKSPDLSITHFVDNLNINQVHEKAQNMLDFGTLYRIGTIDELPADRTFRGAWDIDDADLNDGIAGEEKTKQNLSQLRDRVEQGKENLKQTKEQINISAIESSIEIWNSEISICENKLNELLEKLPLEKRRGYVEPVVEQPEIEEKQDDQS